MAFDPRAWRRLALSRLVYQAAQFAIQVRTLTADRQAALHWKRDVCQRFGWRLPRSERSLWIHGEGFGEFNAARALIAGLASRCPEHRFLLTSSRPAVLPWLQRRYPGSSCLPILHDLPGAPARFFRRLRPELILLLEFHEGFCPGVVLRLQQEGVPIAVVNGRSLPYCKPRRYRLADRLGLNRPLALAMALHCVQSEEGRHALWSLAVPHDRVHVTGNLKFDYLADVVPAPLPGLVRARLENPELVLLAGCLHAQEEELLIDTFAGLRERHPDLNFVIAPQRLAQIEPLARRLLDRHLAFTRMSDPDTRPAPVILLDSYGDLESLYSLATVVLLGGSFYPEAPGHSLVEPAAHGRPIVLGPHAPTQKEMVARFLANGAALQTDCASLADVLSELVLSEARRAELGARARATLARSGGATRRTLELLEPLLPAPIPTFLRAAA